MDQRLKERLIGAVVLVALAVWLIPWLLDGPEREPGTGQVALNLPAAEEAAPKKSVTIDLDESGRPAVPAEHAAPAAAEAQPAPAGGSESDAAPDSAAAAGESTGAEAGPSERVAAVAGGDKDAPVQAREPVEAGERPETASESSDTTRTAESDAATAAASSAAGEWAVQLGSFGQVANAERLAARVKTFGYEPEVSTYSSGGRDLHRVRVGPQPSRARAEAVASALSAHGFVAQVVTAD